MTRLLPALLVAGLSAFPAFAQGTAAPAAAPTAEAPAEGVAPVAPSVGSDAAAASDVRESKAEGEHAQEAGGHAAAAGEHATPHYPLKKPELLNWSFAGPFGHWDVAQLQRGLQVYKEVCSACHSMNLVSFRNLEALGYDEAQVKTFAADYQVQDGPNADGEMFERAGIPTDRFPSPFPNPEAAAAANNGAAPPDFSLIAKARAVERGFPTFVFDIFTQYAEGGPDYIHGLLTGYGQEPPAGVVIQEGTHYNPYFLGGPALAMAQPISDGQVTYSDGAPQTVDQYSRDVAAFLMWAAEPHLAERKATGMVAFAFLVVFAGLLYAVKRRVYAGIPH